MDNDSSSGRIARHLRSLVASSPAGSRLPSTRSLVAELSVSPVSVQRAIQTLVGEGLVETRPGSGTFTCQARTQAKTDFSWQTTALGSARSSAAVGSTLASAPEGAIALHSGYPTDELLPIASLRAALARASRSRAAIDRPPAAGLPEFRAWFARELTHGSAGQDAAHGAATSGSDVVIMPGGQSALSSIFRSLASPGDAIVMESPTYWGAISAARQAGLSIVPIAAAPGAPDPAHLEEVLRSSGAKLFYAQPHFQNPTGTQWSRSESNAIMTVIQNLGCYLIEDDWAHDFAIDATARPLAADDVDGHVVYIRSLTKSISPAVRVAAVVAKGPARARIQTDRTVDHLYVSGILQAAALDVVTQPGWSTHHKRVIGQLRRRRDELASLVVEHLGAETLTHVPKGGLNLWLQLPDAVDTVLLSQRCESAGLLISPAPEWFPAEPSGQFIRLNFSGPQPDRFERAVTILRDQLATF